MRELTLDVVLAVTCLLIAAPAAADVLCAKKSGAVFLRTECRKKETTVTPTNAGLRGPAGPPGPRGQDGLDGDDGEDGEDGESVDSAQVPVAFGVIDADGSVASGTDNVFAYFDQELDAYRITVLGVAYSTSSHTTVVTPISATARTATTASAPGGDLGVRIYDATGAIVQDNFSFLVFQAD